MRRILTVMAAALIYAALTGCTGLEGSPASDTNAQETAKATPTPTVETSSSPAAAVAASPAPMPTATPQTPKSYESEADAKDAIENRAKETVEVLRNKNIDRLAKLVHPEKGVMFTPYANLDPKKDITLQAKDLAAAWNDTAEKTWGHYDGSGESIDLSFADYCRRVSYSRHRP